MTIPQSFASNCLVPRFPVRPLSVTTFSLIVNNSRTLPSRGRKSVGFHRATGLVTFFGASLCSTPGAKAQVSISSTGGGPPNAGGGSDGGGWGGLHVTGESGGSQPFSAKATKAEKEDYTSVKEDVILLDVSGMKCGGCVGRVKRTLEEVPEVTSASVNLATETALVRVILPEASDEAALLAKLEALLCEVLTNVGFKTTVRDQSAASCSAERVLEKKRAERIERLKDATRRLIVAGALASTCLVHHLLHFWHGAPHWLGFLGSTALHAGVSAAALLGPGRQILLDGWRGLISGAPDMNSLVGLGAVASFGMSCAAAALPALGWPTFFEEPAMLLGVVLLGRTLEERAKLAASSDMASLQKLVPPAANLVLENGGIRQVPSDVLQPGDLIVLRPGDRAAVDGIVVSGASTIDEAALTGEPLPVKKSKGSEVMAGTVNVDGTLTVLTKASGSETAIADVVRLVEAAQARTAPVQRLADRVSGVFAYGVMGASLATFAFWATVGTRIFPQALAGKVGAAATAAAAGPLSAKLLLSLQLACNVLVVACPCALGLATPTAVLVGTSAAAKQGLLIRGGDVLETASRVDTVVFDKTGTLTMGRPVIVDMEVGGTFLCEDLLEKAAAVEQNTKHPIARAIVAEAANRGLKPPPVMDGTFHQEPGSGARGAVRESVVVVGNTDWLVKNGVSGCPEELSTRSTRLPGTQVHIGVDGEYAGTVTLQDQVRDGASCVVERLKRSGLHPIMLSGDAQHAAESVGMSLGFSPDSIYGGVNPAGKDSVVEKLKLEGRSVAMIGDGVNDTAALARADVGVAMGGGVDAASEVADIVLLGDRIPQVLDALDISRATFQKIRQNLWWAFGYNLIGIPVAAGALLPTLGIALTPSASGAIMAMSSLGVMGNSLLLQFEAQRIASTNARDVEESQIPDRKPLGSSPQTVGNGSRPSDSDSSVGVVSSV
uniref:Cu2+-exporting ATPase n=1 Tax=Tetraselmis sp. GSL018 TaxID=582737 RepID=A0A061RM52_9CHLO|eukprot:CAMPEP_0177620788 /NCGR_PEP_ID=MMETSP0419_2-20121207/27143_1 /TAXON_ID=582737 /ORGANISM="Tetraselmis sp., Strain GSL018" /LENGTH=949 /DNA_ID=CAMNT_0019120471 /DNA_START=123 /DNA_END=2972 /DNA_ORIENTATION=-